LRDDYALFLGKSIRDNEKKLAYPNPIEITELLGKEVISMETTLHKLNIKADKSPKSNGDFHDSVYYSRFLNEHLCELFKKQADLSISNKDAARLCGIISVVQEELNAVSVKGAHGSGWV
jgi:hypothetical protein